MRLIDKCEEIVFHEDEIRRLRIEVEEETGVPYDEFIDGMRKLLAPLGSATDLDRDHHLE